MGEGLGGIHQTEGCLRITTLDPVATHGVHRLGCKANVAHHWDLGRHERLDHRDATTPALQLDCLGTGPNQRRGVLDRVGCRDVIAHPWHVGDHKGRRVGPGHRSGVVGNVLNGHLQGVVVTEDDHRNRIPYEDHVGTGLIDHPGTRSVVGGEHHQRVASTGDLAFPNDGNRAPLSHFCLLLRPAHSGCRRSRKR